MQLNVLTVQKTDIVKIQLRLQYFIKNERVGIKKNMNDQNTNNIHNLVVTFGFYFVVEKAFEKQFYLLIIKGADKRLIKTKNA